ncbi:F-box family protein [Striga asiatica]|uniref:F-box family protein n=1 Tax=Striga asiatica TaxID=4170 RepID=A0A5A7Q850_STRAF|nr:F-box family protein [Striga asiatica]
MGTFDMESMLDISPPPNEVAGSHQQPTSAVASQCQQPRIDSRRACSQRRPAVHVVPVPCTITDPRSSCLAPSARDCMRPAILARPGDQCCTTACSQTCTSPVRQGIGVLLRHAPEPSVPVRVCTSTCAS